MTQKQDLELLRAGRAPRAGRPGVGDARAAPAGAAAGLAPIVARAPTGITRSRRSRPAASGSRSDKGRPRSRRRCRRSGGVRRTLVVVHPLAARSPQRVAPGCGHGELSELKSADNAELGFPGRRPRRERTCRRRSPVTERSAGFRISALWCYRFDTELAQFDDCRSAPADRVRGERQRERHPVRLPAGLAIAQDAAVPGRRLDHEADRFQPADELANVLPHLGPDPDEKQLASFVSTAAGASPQANVQKVEVVGAEVERRPTA
jgi:hypothetical protein